MIPSIDKMQQGINQITDYVLEVSKGIEWDKQFRSDDTQDKGN